MRAAGQLGLGLGAFGLGAKGRKDFARAVLKKMILEIADRDWGAPSVITLR